MAREDFHKDTQLNFGLGEFWAEVSGETYTFRDIDSRTKVGSKIDTVRLFVRQKGTGTADLEISEDTARDMFLRLNDGTYQSLWDFAQKEAELVAERMVQDHSDWRE